MQENNGSKFQGKVIKTQKFQDTKVINQQIEALSQWLIQETLSPDILPYRLQIIEGQGEDIGIRELIQQQQDGIDVMKEQMKEQKSLNKQKDNQYITLHVIEYERIKYIYSQYLRVRLKKISDYAFHIYKTKKQYLLSQAEKQFHESLVKLVKDKFDKMILNSLPSQLKSCGLQENTDAGQEKIDVVSPNEDQWFIARSEAESRYVNGVQIEEGDYVLAPFSNLKTYVVRNEMTLQ